MQKVSFRLAATPPYDFDLTAAYATYFRGRYATESYDGHYFRRPLEVNGQFYLATVRSTGTVGFPELEVGVAGDEFDDDSLVEICRQVAWILGTDQNLTPFYRMVSRDAALAPLVRELVGLHIPHSSSVYEALVSAILGQQVSAQVARMLRTLLVETYGDSFDADGVTYHTFPPPAIIASAGIEGLRAVKFSARKSEYLIDITRHIASGELDLEALREQPEDVIVETLMGLRGVGQWTAEWLLIRAFGATDGFPYNDLALRRTLSALWNEDEALPAEEILERSQRWSPYRGYVTAYLFAGIRSGRVPALAGRRPRPGGGKDRRRPKTGAV